ncbi:MAG: YHS domain-containing protein [Candidatus Marsarchaeota archaeon]|nr:YHS domain-containing protein [Candidatus Marsarchaeota archaeon]
MAEKDPVCGMVVDSSSKLSSSFDGKVYRFCSAACKAAFDKEPRRYAK